MIRSATLVEKTTDIFRLVLVGKVYAPDAPAVEAKIIEAVTKGARHVLIACYSLEQVDSAVLSAIIAGLEHVKTVKNGKIVFIALNPTIRRILSLTKMDRFFPIVADEPEALKLLSQDAPGAAS